MQVLSKREKLVIIISTIFSLSNVLSSLFLNVYLFTYTQDLVSMAIYTSIRLILFPPSEIMAARIARKKGYTYPIMFGLMMIMASLVFTLYVGEGFAHHHNLVYIVAMMTGIGEGSYYLCINTLNQKCSTPSTRASFLSIAGVLGNLGAMIGPFISTYILSISTDDIAGYTTIFKLILVFYFLIFVICGFLKMEKEEHSIKVFPVLKINNDDNWRYNCILNLVNGVRDVFPLALSGLMVYEATGGSGEVYSQLLSIFSVITIVGCWYFKRYLDSEKWLKLYNVGAIISAISMIAMVVFHNLFGAILYGVCNALSTGTFANPFSFDTMNILGEYKDSIMSRMVAKEIYLTVGRVGSMALVVILSFLFPKGYLTIGAIIAALSPIVVVLMVNKHHHFTLRKEKK